MADIDKKELLAWLNEAPESHSEQRMVEALSAGADPDAPLAKALAEQPGDVVTVTDPTEGELGRFTRDGRRMMSPAEVEATGKANLHEAGMKALLSFLSGGGPLADEGYGALKAITTGGKPGESFGDAYRRYRNTARKDMADATRDVSPQVAGVPVLPVVGSMVATAPLSEATGALKLFGAGALSSGVLGAGESNADLTKAEGSDFAQDIGTQALMGGAGAVVGNAAAKVPGALFSKAAGAMREAAPINALKALGLRAGITNALKQLGYDTPDAAKWLGDFALKKGLVKPGQSADDVFNATTRALESTGKELDPIYANAQKASGGVDAGEAAHRATMAYTGKGLDVEARAQQQSAADVVKRILEQGDVDSSFPAMRKLKTSLQRGTDYRTETPLSAELRRKAVSGLRQSMEEQVSRALSPAEAQRLATLNADYGALKDISKLSLDEAQRNFGRQSAMRSGLASTLAGAAEGPGGAIAGAVPTAVKEIISPARAAWWQNLLAPEVDAAAKLMTPMQAVGAPAGASSSRSAADELRRRLNE